MKKALILALLPLMATSAAPASEAAEAPTTAVGAPAADSTAAPLRVPDTLMFTIDEYNDIQGHLSRGGTDEKKGDARGIEDASLFLSTILYIGPDDWTIWVNGVPIGPHDEFSSFKVTDISPRSVELMVPLSAQGVRPVRLGPNQSFITKSGLIIEGRVP